MDWWYLDESVPKRGIFIGKLYQLYINVCINPGTRKGGLSQEANGRRAWQGVKGDIETWVLNSWLVISNNTHLSLTVSHGKVSSLLGLKVGVCLDLKRLWVKLAPGSTLVGNREIKEDWLDLQKMEAPLIQNWEKPSCPSSPFVNTVNLRFIDAEEKNNTTIPTRKPKQDNHRALVGQKSRGSQVKPTTLYPQCRCKLSDVESKQYETYSMSYKYSKNQNNKTCNVLQ